MGGLDAYTRNARLKPALLVLAPAAWTVMAWSADHILGWGGFWTLFVAAGGTAILAQFARDGGKRKENELFEKHGGRPTERLLSHECTPNKVTLARRHSVLARLVPNIVMPSAADEAKDRRAANAIYASCAAWLIARTRDDRLLLQENINYGFRRNLWGLKPWGLTMAASATIVLGLRLYLQFVSHVRVSPLVIVFEACNVLMIAFWVLVVNTAWAMVPARAYAERLFGALDRLESTQ